MLVDGNAAKECKLDREMNLQEGSYSSFKYGDQRRYHWWGSWKKYEGGKGGGKIKLKKGLQVQMLWGRRIALIENITYNGHSLTNLMEQMVKERK